MLAVNYYHAGLLNVEISTEVSICWNRRSNDDRTIVEILKYIACGQQISTALQQSYSEMSCAVSFGDYCSFQHVLMIYSDGFQSLNCCIILR